MSLSAGAHLVNYHEETLQEYVARLPEDTVRKLLLTAAAHHADVEQALQHAASLTRYAPDDSAALHARLSGELEDALAMRDDYQRLRALKSLMMSLEVVADVGQAQVAMQAMRELAERLAQPEELDGSLWEEITSPDGLMDRISHAMAKAVPKLSPQQARRCLDDMEVVDGSLADYGVGALHVVVRELRRRASEC